MAPRESHSLESPHTRPCQVPYLPFRSLMTLFSRSCLARLSPALPKPPRFILELISGHAIRYALCSLSALNRMSTMSPTDSYYTASKLRSYALQQYNHAIRCTQTLLTESSDGSADKLIKGLVACVLFVCYENFTGNHQVAHMHLQNGLKIIARECHKQRNSNIPKDIVQVFKRLDIQAITIGDSKIPYPDHLSKEHIELLTTPPTQPSVLSRTLSILFYISADGYFTGQHTRNHTQSHVLSLQKISSLPTKLWSDGIWKFRFIFRRRIPR